MVVLDMVSEGQRRSLPALGNVPVVRYNPPPAAQQAVNAQQAADDEAVRPAARVACRRVAEALLLERVNALFFEERSKAWARRIGRPEGGWISFSPPPDLLAIVSKKTELSEAQMGIYPDPPLPSFESELLGIVAGAGVLTTPLALASKLHDNPANPTRPLRVAVSISNPPESELIAKALSNEHVTAVFLTLCRFLLAAGHTIAFGGDPLKNFTTALGDLERTYRFTDPDGDQRLVNYVARYLHSAPAFKGELEDVMRIVKVPRDVTAGEPESLPPLLDLTAMRHRMLAETDVRVIAAGDLEPGAPGTRRGPGVLEEAYLSLQADQPLIVIGGFGGAGRLVADALRGRRDATEETALRDHFASREDLSAAEQQPVTFDDMIAAFTSGVELHNELDAEENERLWTTTDVDEIAALVVTAVSRISAA
jgi:hypothetical protein